MANAKKCDLCGKYFDLSTRQTVVPDVALGISVRYSTTHLGKVANVKYDTCDDCLSALDRLINNLMEGKGENNG